MFVRDPRLKEARLTGNHVHLRQDTRRITYAQYISAV